MILFFLRTVLLYLVLIFVIRLMGKRQIGQMEPSEFVVTMVAANLVTIPMEDAGTPLYTGLVPVLTVLALELILSAWMLRSLRLRRLLCGRPVLLVHNGSIQQENLRRTRVTVDELLGLLRLKNVLDPTTVQYAILETDGSLSVFPYPVHCPATAGDAGICPGEQSIPLVLVSDGKVLEENLRASGKTQAWVRKILRQHHAELGDTWLLTVDRQQQVHFFPREQP